MIDNMKKLMLTGMSPFNISVAMYLTIFITGCRNPDTGQLDSFPPVAVEQPGKVKINKPQRRLHEIGIVALKKFKWGTKSRRKYFPNAIKALAEKINSFGWKTRMVSMDIFLPSGKDARDTYKRILIPGCGYSFFPEMYEGMTDYVRCGGLLITNSSLIGIDTNRNYKMDKEDSLYRRKRAFNTLGVHGHSGAQIKSLTVLMECPLTKGFKTGQKIKLDKPLKTRSITNSSATVVVASDGIDHKRPFKNRPFLTFKHQNKGACIYLPLNIKPFLKNSLSQDTLEWLTAGE